MFIGHYAVALAAKKVAPKASLGTLFLGVQLADQLWPILLLLGIEHASITPGITVVTPFDLYDYPISHSLLGLMLWSGGVAGVYYAVRKYKQGAIVLAACVCSHWILDFITHRPDMPLGLGTGTKLGLGLWNSLAGTIVVEVSLFTAGVWLYLRTTTPTDKTGVYSFWALIAFLGILYIGNLFGPPPPDIMTIAIGANAGWLLILWAYWIDRHRSLKIVDTQTS